VSEQPGQGLVGRGGESAERKRLDVAQSVVFSMGVLEEVAARQPVSLVDLAKSLGSPKTTVLRALRALEVAGYVFQDTAHPRWSLTLRSLRLAEAAASNLGLVDAALPVMQELSLSTEETVSLGVLERGSIVVVSKVDGRKAVRAYSERGAILPIHASSSGKALLAELDEDELRRLLPKELPRFTDATITDFGELALELDRTRLRGYAINDGERQVDVLGVGATIRDASGVGKAAISVALPRQQADPESMRAIARHCMAAADEVSRRLGWNGRRP
jgi:IclR family transcriptional regulator, acetate operon repressor